MKKAITLLFLTAILLHSFAQNNEKEEKKVSISINGFVNLNAIVDFNGLVHYDDFTTSEIPIHPTPFEESMRFHMTARQSRLDFNINYNLPEGVLKSKISGDFYSDEGGESFFRLREAYLQYKHLLLGQTNTTFGNPDVSPSTIDFEGPNSAPTLRNPMIAYTNSFNKKWTYGLAIEMRGTDITILDTNISLFNALPTFVGNINRLGDWGVVTLSMMSDLKRYFTIDENAKAKIGFGGALSVIINTSKSDHLNIFAVGGRGIANFISDLSGLGYNGILTASPTKMDLLTSYGGFIGYTHYWNEKWNSNIVYSFVGMEKTSLLPNNAFYHSNYALGNLFYEPTKHLIFGVEYIWGNLYNQIDETGDANRLQFLAQFNF